jgi:E3 ubiquitin-protein ligase TRIP12
LVCGGTRDEAWDVKTLEDNFVPAHGYTQTSKSFKNFVKIVSEFTSEEKRIFLKFVTGAERLPFGGI